ncbi:IS5 family transposase [Belnapia mucosa]|uniref:IS5 family transposase n=1 Tax=Belnapia mucosa TaxID=2804532 RepID=UPI001F26E70C|nr:IS5 family transposase [Belnapia mucosa]
MNARKPYPSDVSDDEWALVAPYLTLLPETAGQREHALREVFNGLRYVIKIGAPWRWMPNDLSPGRRSISRRSAGWRPAASRPWPRICALCWVAAGRKAQPSAAILDSRTLRSSPESGARAGYGGAKRKRGSKLHLAVDTLGHLLALHVTPASTDDRAEVGRLARAVQSTTGQSVDLAYVDQGYTGPKAADAAKAHGIELEVVKLTDTKRGFVLLPRRWVVERTFAWPPAFADW